MSQYPNRGHQRISATTPSLPSQTPRFLSARMGCLMGQSRLKRTPERGTVPNTLPKSSLPLSLPASLTSFLQPSQLSPSLRVPPPHPLPSPPPVPLRSPFRSLTQTHSSGDQKIAIPHRILRSCTHYCVLVYLHLLRTRTRSPLSFFEILT